MADNNEEDIWPLEELINQLHFVIVMINGLMTKMMDVHSGLCGTCKENTDTEHELVGNMAYDMACEV